MGSPVQPPRPDPFLIDLCALVGLDPEKTISIHVESDAPDTPDGKAQVKIVWAGMVILPVGEVFDLMRKHGLTAI